VTLQMSDSMFRRNDYSSDKLVFDVDSIEPGMDFVRRSMPQVRNA